MNKICFLLLLPLLSACSGYSISRSGFSLIQKSEKFSENKIEKILLIAPEKGIYRVENNKLVKFYKDPKVNEKQFFDALEITAVLNDINIEILPEYKLDGKLIDLKRNINQSGLLQINPFSSAILSKDAVFYQDVMVITPKLFYEYSSLSKKYGTPYIGISGLLFLDVKSEFYSPELQQLDKPSVLFYIIIANIESGEIIYREIKKMPGKLNNSKLYPFLYDSFYLLKKNMTK